MKCAGTGTSYPPLPPWTGPNLLNYTQAAELDAQFFFSGTPWDMVARNYTALTLNLANGSNLTQYDVVGEPPHVPPPWGGGVPQSLHAHALGKARCAARAGAGPEGCRPALADSMFAGLSTCSDACLQMASTSLSAVPPWPSTMLDTHWHWPCESECLSMLGVLQL
jgi:hypothetical protein